MSKSFFWVGSVRPFFHFTMQLWIICSQWCWSRNMFNLAKLCWEDHQLSAETYFFCLIHLFCWNLLLECVSLYCWHLRFGIYLKKLGYNFHSEESNNLNRICFQVKSEQNSFWLEFNLCCFNNNYGVILHYYTFYIKILFIHCLNC